MVIVLTNVSDCSLYLAILHSLSDSVLWACEVDMIILAVFMRKLILTVGKQFAQSS